MNSVKFGNFEITAKTSYSCHTIFVTLDIAKNGVKIASISSCDIDRKIKPENRGAIKDLVKFAVKNHVYTEKELVEIANEKKFEKMDSDYKKRYNTICKAMSV